jgi:hypothetical protein
VQTPISWLNSPTHKAKAHHEEHEGDAGTGGVAAAVITASAARSISGAGFVGRHLAFAFFAAVAVDAVGIDGTRCGAP